MALNWRSRNMVHRIQSTAKLFSTRNGTRARHSPIRTSAVIYNRAVLAQLDASISSWLRMALMADHHGVAMNRRWITFGPAPELSTGVIARISAWRCLTVAETVKSCFLKKQNTLPCVRFTDCIGVSTTGWYVLWLLRLGTGKEGVRAL